MKIDCHVHWVGNGSNGSGCWLRPRGIHRFLYHYMLRQLGLPPTAMQGNLDELYEEKLLADLRSSSLDAVVVLAMDDIYDDRGKVMEGQGVFYVPNDCVLDLAAKHPELIPAVSIHPSRPDAMEELDRCLEKGAAMLKLLPNVHNVDCNDSRHEKFWNRMAEAGLPLLAHTGSEHTLPVIHARLADPEALELPLRCGVRVIAAHSAAPNAPWDRNGLTVLLKMMEKFPGLYADTSAFNTPWRARYYHRVLESGLPDRFLHGSDYPVPVMSCWPRLWGLMKSGSDAGWNFSGNLLERDCQIKRSVGFSERHFTDASFVLRMEKRGRKNERAHF